MTLQRADKIARIAGSVPIAEPFGDNLGDLLVVGWGGTYGALHEATLQARSKHLKVSHLHLRHLNPFPANLEKVLRQFKNILVAELNLGQLDMLLRSRFAIDTIRLNKVQGQPFTVSEVFAAIENAVRGEQR